MEHEYALIGGVNRANVGRWISVAASFLSGVCVFILLSLFDIAKQFGIATNLPPTVLSLVAASSIFVILYWLFDRVVWKWAPLNRWLLVPDLSGEWTCEGQALNRDRSPSHAWTGKVTIVQNWDRLRIRLRTHQSGSNSITAALVHDQADGCRLLYNYHNDPRIEAAGLRGHRGFAELTFAKDCQSAEGEYFNGNGRFTFGTMKLRRH